MRIIDILTETMKIRPDISITNEEGLKLINTLEKRIYNDIISTHEMPEIKYTHDNAEEEASLPDEHIGIYILYIFTHYDLVRSEMKRYQNDMTAYNLAYSNYQDYINRTYMPKQKAGLHW